MCRSSGCHFYQLFSTKQKFLKGIHELNEKFMNISLVKRYHKYVIILSYQQDCQAINHIIAMFPYLIKNMSTWAEIWQNLWPNLTCPPISCRMWWLEYLTFQYISTINYLNFILLSNKYSAALLLIVYYEIVVSNNL